LLLLLQVNNAAVSFNEIDTNSVEHAETVLRTNFYGAKMLTEALLPLFRQSSATSRILNISSQLGLLNVSLFTVCSVSSDELATLSYYCFGSKIDAVIRGCLVCRD
jgi:NAD(P)-dependent dehydrogenase (short-subunit alcohol dehydrogenase family)